MYDPLDYKLSEFNSLEPKKGRILISDPFLPDPYFKRSVVLLVEHNDEGSLGFILNKTLEITLADTELKIDGANHKMYFGGPVQSTDLFYVHSRKDLTGSTKVTNGLYWGGDFSEIEGLIRDDLIKEDEIRFFVGYSGWEAEQLVNEIADDSWLVAEIDHSMLFDGDIGNLWKKILESMDERISILSTFPEDPNMN